MTLRSLALLCLVGAPFAFPVLANDQDKSKPAETQNQAQLEPAKPDSDEIQTLNYEVTVTATRTATPLRQLGRSVTLISRGDLEASGARTVHEALERTPGFHVAQSGSYGGPVSVFVRGGESDFNLVLIDGVQVNRAGGEFDFANLSTANVDRIEIVRGPTSVLYGTEAVSSTINIITTRGSSLDAPTGSISAEVGTYGSRDFQGALSGGSERVHYAFGALVSETDGIFDLNSQYRRSDLSASSSVELNTSSSLAASLRYATARQRFPTSFTGAVIDPNDFRDSREQVYSVDFQHSRSADYDSKLQYGFYQLNASNNTLEDGIDDFFTDVFEVDENRHYLDWQNNFRFFPGHTLTTGLSYKREDSPTIDQNRRSVGVYLQDQFNWQDRFFLTGGIRYDNNNLFSSFLTGHLDLALLVNDQVKLRGAVGNGFRAPAFSEIIGFPEFGLLGNPALDPEKNISLEFGTDLFSLFGRLGVSFTVYFNRYRDLIEFTFGSAPGSPNYFNVEGANSEGVELEGSYRINEDFALGGNYTLTHTKVTDSGSDPFGNFEEGEHLLRRPKHTALFYFRFQRRSGRFQADLLYTGRREDRQFFPDFSSARVVLPGYVKVNLSAALPIARLTDSRGELAILFRAENLFNEEYTQIAGFQSPGRRLSGGLEFLF